MRIRGEVVRGCLVQRGPTHFHEITITFIPPRFKITCVCGFVRYRLSGEAAEYTKQWHLAKMGSIGWKK